MKRINVAMATLLSLVLLLTVGCNSKQKKNEFKGDFQGMYVGELPCADCSGILTYTTLTKDNDAIITSIYQEEDQLTTTEKGMWKIENGLLTVCLPNQKLYYTQVSDSVIMMTDSLGNSAENLAKNYELTKVKALTTEDFAGKFYEGEIDQPNGYVQFLEIQPNYGDKVNIKISSQTLGKGCTFESEGVLVNNQIEVAMNQHHPKMESTMIIRFVGDDHKKLVLTTAVAADRYDLMYFCGGGGSLQGEYTFLEKK